MADASNRISLAFDTTAANAALETIFQQVKAAQAANKLSPRRLQQLQDEPGRIILIDLGTLEKREDGTFVCPIHVRASPTFLAEIGAEEPRGARRPVGDRMCLGDAPQPHLQTQP